jgi:methylglutaconyl-CoA hydratase
MAMSDLVIVEPIECGLSVLTLNRAERRNALSIALLDALSDALNRLQADHSQRVVILRGSGPVFSAGLDLKEAADAALVETSATSLERALAALRQSPLVTVAAVQGGAYAGGAGIMAACDLAIAADSARFGFPEARRGLLPALICGVLRHKIREGDLRDLFLVGDDISAHDARQVGLIQRVVPEADLLQSALAVARSVLRGGPDAIRQTKHLLNAVFGETGTVSAQLGEMHLKARHSDEAREGLAAFLEKREPHWK